jgi:Mg-chelatase subunit ChlD
MKRMKFVRTAAVGSGHCASEWDPGRLHYKECNNIPCLVNDTFPTLTCNKALDVVLLIDGSGSLTQQGWAAELKAANTFVDAFLKAGADAQIAVILFSGPRTWSGVSKCMGKDTGAVDIEHDCKVKTITHYTNDLAKVKKLISGMSWPMGSTLTSIALMKAKAEISLGRRDSHSNIIVFTDGRPLSLRKTGLASRTLRKVARLLWVPVTKFAPLQDIKQWATRRWEENVIVVNSFGDLEKPEVVTQIIANICPHDAPQVEFARGLL